MTEAALLTDADAWRSIFDAPAPCTIGVEDEVMVLDAESLDLAPRGGELAAAAANPQVRIELPAAQLELVGGPHERVGSAIAELRVLRERAAALARDRGLRLAGCGAHPFARPEGALNDGARYRRVAAEYGPAARRQLVFGLHVHVCVRGAERSLAVYNALREHLPELAALGANAPVFAGRDREVASVRPQLAALLPRQGVPPAFGSWPEVAEAHRFGQASGAVPDASSWWWELRPHPRWGTLEVRVPDGQTTLADAAALAAVVHALAVWLADRHDAGDLPADPVATWRIDQNRWSACRHGLHGTMADPRSGAPEPTGERLARLLERLAPVGARLGCADELRHAQALARCNPSDRLRAVVAERGTHAATAWLAGQFLA